MSPPLTQAIVAHILHHLGILNPTLPLHSESFLTSKQIFYVENGKKRLPVYGASIQQESLTIHVISCEFPSSDGFVVLFADNLPFYGLSYGEESSISFSQDGKAWLGAPVHMQATLLASLELLGEHLTLSRPLEESGVGYKALLEFLEFRS